MVRFKVYVVVKLTFSTASSLLYSAVVIRLLVISVIQIFDIKLGIINPTHVKAGSF